MQPPLLEVWTILGGSATPSNAKLLTIFPKFFYSAADLPTYFNICLQCQGCSNEGVTPFHVEILAVNQPNLKFLLEICAILSSQSVKRFCREIKPFFSEYYDTLG